MSIQLGRLFLALQLVWIFPASAANLPYQDTSLTVDQRVDDLVGRMTTEEKISQIVNDAPAIERLGIRAYNWWNEGIHGYLSPEAATVFPQAIGMAATWDRDVMESVGTVISDDARTIYQDSIKHDQHGMLRGLTLWTPNINIFRDPRWGRGQETYGEDPYLTGSMVVPLIHGLQGNDPHYFKTISTPKHFAVHSGPDAIRSSFDAKVSLKDLWETYLPAFRSAFLDGKAYSVMTSYNSINGIPASVHPLLLGEALRGAWGFQGYVVSDCGAVGNIYDSHFYITDPALAVATALRAGLDVECGDSYTTHLPEAVRRGLIASADLDRAVKRAMKARFLLGMFDPDSAVPWTHLSMDKIDGPENRALALRMGRESMVLLKNQDHFLPLDPHRIHRLAVIGPNADNVPALQGDYSGHSRHHVTPLEALTNRAQAIGAQMTYAPGCGLTTHFVTKAVISDWLSPDGDFSVHGLRAEYFTNPDLQGEPKLQRTDAQVDFDWGQKGPEGLQPENFSARWQGYLRVPTSGEYFVGTRSDDGSRLWVDDALVADQWSDHSLQQAGKAISLEAGRAYRVRMEYYQRGGDASAQLVISEDGFNRAIQAARASDVAVVFLGISPEVESEGRDREDISLPSPQLELLRAVRATGTPTVLVLMNGGAISDGWSAEHIDGILEAWYPGEEGGNAVADVLFGDYNPAGRLPVTIYRSVADLPAFDDYNLTNRTYRYFTGKPLYPFGYGLSYSHFRYGNLEIPRPAITAGTEATVHFTVTNDGSRDGDEVAELYLSRTPGPRTAAVAAPIRSLRGYRRVFLRAGETKRLEFTLNARDMSLVGADGRFVVESGVVNLAIGGRQPVGESDSEVLHGKFAVTGSSVMLPK